MNNLTRFFLILVRLALAGCSSFEGFEKVQSVRMGPTVDNKPWTSAGYLKQSSGPLAPFFQWQAGGDADDHALECLTVDTDASKPAHDRASLASPSRLGAVPGRFADHYKLNADQRQEAHDKLDEEPRRRRAWITNTTDRKELEKNSTFATATFVPRRRRIASFRASSEGDELAEVGLQDEVNPSFGEDVYKAKLRTMKADAAKMRTDLDGPTSKSSDAHRP